MTVSRGVLRIGGTIVGGTLGFLIMLNHRLATDPYALMASPLAPPDMQDIPGSCQNHFWNLLLCYHKAHDQELLLP
jgi:hypothetical protein